MNLHAVVGPLIAVINPREAITIAPSTGSTTAADGDRVPSYGTPQTVLAQVQELSQRDIYQTSGLTLQGVQVTAYLPGAWAGVIRADQRGGDIVTRADGSTWLVTAILEMWPGWCKVVLTLQDGA
jgi:hypothetical protein